MVNRKTHQGGQVLQRTKAATDPEEDPEHQKKPDGTQGQDRRHQWGDRETTGDQDQHPEADREGKQEHQAHQGQKGQDPPGPDQPKGMTGDQDQHPEVGPRGKPNPQAHQDQAGTAADTIGDPLPPEDQAVGNRGEHHPQDGRTTIEEADPTALAHQPGNSTAMAGRVRTESLRKQSVQSSRELDATRNK